METPTQTQSGSAGDAPVIERALEKSRPILEWSAPRAHSHDRTPRWYMIAGGIVLMIAVYGILTSAWSLTLAVLLVGGLYYVNRNEPARLHSIQIEEDGFTYDGTFTHWGDCKEFWVVQTPLATELHILRKKGTHREVMIQTGNISGAVIRAEVGRFLEVSSDRHERFVDMIIRLCKL